MKMRKVVNYILFIQLAARCHLIGAFYNRVQRSLPSQDNSLTCNYFCPVESNMTEWLLPPKFEQPCAPKDIQNTYYTKQGIDHVVIRWTEPVATDENGDFPSVRQVKGGINGGTFLGTVWGQTHSIVYLATDKDGLIDNCHFNFTVIVPSCAKLGVVNNGSYTCTNSTAPGSSCMVTCDEGFRLPRSENATCGYTSVANKFPNWTNIQQCEKVKCGSPKAPDNANITCLNNIYSYNTVCKVLCHQGFLMVGPQYTICQAKGTWSVQSLCTRERPSGTHCSPNLCNGHSCIQNHNDTYTCKCSHGWSGTTCKNPPDYCSENICMNDATCNSHNDSYTCSCRAGYSGYLCQNYPIDGQWSDWSFWSKCSATCGSGFQTRHRACNNPPADTYGKPCHGSHTVIRKCESKTCEACPELVHRNESLAYIECETDQSFGLRTCMITCKNGTIHTPWFTEFSKLKCGFETNYSWVPGMVQAPCIVPVLPNVLRLDTEITYRTLIPNENHLAVKDQVRENIKDTNCLQSTQCNTTITLTSTQIGNDKKTKLDLIFRRYIKHFVRNESYSFDDKGLALEAVGGDKLTEVVNHTGKDKTLRISETAYTNVSHLENLPFEYIIHVNSPVWDTDHTQNEKDLKKTLSNVLDVVCKRQSQVRVKSLSIPSISSGAARFPKDTASKIILKGILDYANGIKVGSSCPLKKIYCVLYDNDSVDAYQKQFDIVYNSRFRTFLWLTSFTKERNGDENFLFSNM